MQNTWKPIACAAGLLLACSGCDGDRASGIRTDPGNAHATPDGNGGGGAKAGSGDTKHPVLGHAEAALRKLSGCADLEKYLIDNALADMNQQLDNRLSDYLDNGICGDWGGGLDAGLAAPPSAGGDGDSASEPTSVSMTNNQVAGVDEADMVKNDGHYLYITSGKSLHIIEAWPAASSHEVSRVDLGGPALKSFVLDDRALVYVSDGESARAECTYGYDCDFTGDGSGTRLLVLDIKDRAHPKTLRELRTSGSLLAARRIGSTVHTVVSDVPNPVWYPTFPDSIDCDKKLDEASARRAFDELKKQNEQTIRTSALLKTVPNVNDSAAGVTSLVADCSDLYASSQKQGASYTTLVSLDMSKDEPVTTATVVSRPGAIYAAQDALYMAVRDASYDPYADTENQTGTETSFIHRFRIGERPELTAYEASGKVPGHVLHQFSMDEYQDHLRVATSVGFPPDPNTHSVLSVLEQVGKDLKTVGKVDNIQPKEDIRSVRFDGDRGFIVTFEKTDPLFIFDLEDPAHPTMLGKLEIPGFSTYMHLMDRDHILSIGYDADDQGDFSWFAGVMLQIFDVSNLKSPKLVHKQVIGTRGSSSEALTNHLAFNYFAERNLLAFPLHICEGGSGGMYGDTMTFNGLMVYDVDVTHGFKERGRVAHPNADGSYPDSECYEWWADAGSDVKRSVIMDQFVYSIANDAVRVQSLDQLGTDVSEVTLADQ